MVFTPEFSIIFESLIGGGEPQINYVTIDTPENGKMQLTEGIPVNVSIKGMNYLLSFKVNKFNQPVFTLSK